MRKGLFRRLIVLVVVCSLIIAENSSFVVASGVSDAAYFELEESTEVEVITDDIEVENSTSVAELPDDKQESSSEDSTTMSIDENEEVLLEDVDYSLSYSTPTYNSINGKNYISIIGIAGHEDGIYEDIVIPKTIYNPYYKETYIVNEIKSGAFKKVEGKTVLKGNLTIEADVTYISSEAFAGQDLLTGSLVLPDSVEQINASAFADCKFEGNLIIPENCKYINESAFARCTEFTGDLVIPQAVTKVGPSAFSGCTGFDGKLDITKPESVTIGSGAFKGCTGFSELKLGSGVTSIGDEAFYGCSGLKGDLVIGSGVSNIGKKAFTGCDGYNGYLSVNAENIGESAFDGCKSFPGGLIIGDNVKTISKWAFRNCSGFKGDLVIPDNVTTMGIQAFLNCSGFDGNLKIGSGLKAIPEGAFDACSGIKAVTDMGQSVESVDAAAFYGMTSLEKVLVFPDSVKDIGKNVAGQCTKLPGVTFGKNVETIGESAFYNLKGLTGDLQFGDNLKSIGKSAFYGCDGLNGTLSLGNGVESIGDYAFQYCSSFKGNLIIPDSTTKIGTETFKGCSGFDGNLTIGNGLKIIESETFYNCNGFKGKLTLGSSLEEIKSNAFLGCSGFSDKLILPSGLTTIGYAAFTNCSGFTGGLVIPDAVTSIGKFAFNNCSGFDGCLTLSNSLGMIPEAAFKNCTKLSGGLVIPDSVTTIEREAFYDCKGFDGDLDAGKNTTSIGVLAFKGCSGFKGTLSLGSSLKTIGQQAFENCSGFTGDLIIPSQVTDIGIQAFYECKGFNGKLDIKGPITAIKTSTFAWCEGLTGNITIPDTVETIEESAFYHSGFDGNLFIPSSVRNIGYSAFSSTNIKDKVIIPATVTFLKKDILEYCTKLTEVENNTVIAVELPTVDKYHWINKNSKATIREVASGTAVLVKDDDNPPNPPHQSEIPDPDDDKIKITLDDGNGHETEITIDKDGKYGELPVPSRDGKVFLGWYDNPEFAGEPINSETVITNLEPHRLYAKWGDEDPKNDELKVEAPQFNYQDGSYVKADTLIEILSNTPDAQIYYKIGDASEFIEYTEGFTIDGNLTIIAYATKTGWINSDFTQVTYSFINDASDLGDVEIKDLPNKTSPDQSLDDIIPDDLWVAGIENTVYTGSSIKQNIRVYDGKKLLKEKVDYTLVYSNNTNVGHASLVVKLKSNYSGEKEYGFEIIPKDIAELTISKIESTNKKTTKAVNSVKYGKKTLKEGQDYTVTYVNSNSEIVERANLIAGRYRVTVEGINNYKGAANFDYVIADVNQYAMSGAKVTLTSKSVAVGSDVPTIKSIKIGGKTYTTSGILKISDVFEVTYSEDSDKPGEHTIKIKPISADIYVGDTVVPYTVTGAKINKNMFNVSGQYIYEGKAILADVTSSLIAGRDYTVSYSNNIKAGRATVTINGMGNYAGTVKLTYNIAKRNISETTITVNGSSEYDKAGTKADITVKIGDNVLKEGIDYSIALSKNAPGNAAVQVTGKGSCSGKSTVNFEIVNAPLSDDMITVNDLAYSSKKTSFCSKVAVMQGKKALKSNEDYIVSYSGDGIVTAEDMVKGYKEITVTVSAKEGSKYRGVASKKYTVYDAASRKINSLSISIQDQVYNGKPILPDASNITVKTASGTIIPSEDISVISAKNNVKVGNNASAVISVKGYGLTKTVRFKILARKAAE